MSKDGSKAGAARPLGPCPTCGKPALEAFRPFCSSRCRDVDLHRWLSGRYAIPVTDDTDEDGALPETAAPGLSEEPDKN